MPRVTLLEQPQYEHQHALSVRVTDINYAGHLSNEALLGLIHEARTNFLSQLGFDTIVKEQQPVGLIIADLIVNFKAEAFAGDQLLIESQIGDIGKKSFRLFHRIMRGDVLIALVETGVVAFSFNDRQTVVLPETFLNELMDYRKRRMEHDK